MANARPNILFLFSDQHAQRVAGCYGDSFARTPNLDRLASGGVVFDNCYTPSPICTPARMSMLTARYPYRQQVWTNDDVLRSDIPAFPHALGLAGYTPTLVGRMHALGPDQLHGYANRYVGDHSPNWPGKPRTGMGPLAGTTSPTPESIERSGAGKSVYELLDQSTTSKATSVLDEISQSDTDDPFFLTVGFMLPHAPYVADPEDYALFDDAVPPVKNGSPDPETDNDFMRRWREHRSLDHVVPEDAARARQAYYALTYRLDQMIGQILDRLTELGLDENTLIVYSSDHGDQIGERGLWWKHTFYDDSAKVPLILNWPGVLPSGERREQLVDLLDVTATILDAAQAPPLPNSDGRSFLALAKGEAIAWDNRVFSEYCMDASPEWTLNETLQQRMIRRDQWKLNYYNGYTPQLFNLIDDPDELNDLGQSEEHVEVREKLLAELLAEWDPDVIARTMEARAGEIAFMKSWAKTVDPPDPLRWQFQPEQNRLLTPETDDDRLAGQA